jgi:hypothetical protein
MRMLCCQRSSAHNVLAVNAVSHASSLCSRGGLMANPPLEATGLSAQTGLQTAAQDLPQAKQIKLQVQVNKQAAACARVSRGWTACDHAVTSVALGGVRCG